MSSAIHRFAYSLLLLTVIANFGNGAVAGADVDLEAIPTDLWCDDISEFCNRYLDLPRDECYAKFSQNCIRTPVEPAKASEPKRPRIPIELDGPKLPDNPTLEDFLVA